MKGSRRAVAALVLGTLLLIAPAAFGSSRTISDRDDVPKHRVDIKSASHSHTRGKLKHTVVAYRAFKTSRGPCVTFETNGRGRKDYQVCGYSNMINLHQQTTKGTVSMRRPNRRTISYIFRPRAIGRPDVYKWFVIEPGSDECKCDRAPNKGLVRHALN